MQEDKDSWHFQETYKSLMDYGTNLLQYCFLTNGAAIIALLTFVGNLSGKSLPVPDMRLPAGVFVLGLVFAGVAGLLAYIVQFNMLSESFSPSNANGRASHKRGLWFTLAAVILSMALFAVGSLVAVFRLH
jgi:hypothetical protein